MESTGTTLKVIARMRSGFSQKFGIPRQSGMVEALTSTVVFEPEYRNAEALRGLADFSHIWLIWGFDKAVRDAWSPTVRPPRLGGNRRVGVFATRSPFRPNALGLSSVRLLGIERCADCGLVLNVAGADLLDGTPIYDIKPYLAYTDSHEDALGGFVDEHQFSPLDVIIPDELNARIPADILSALRGILAHDPRPSYQSEAARVYGVTFGGLNVKFSVDGGALTVTDVTKEFVE